MTDVLDLERARTPSRRLGDVGIAAQRLQRGDAEVPVRNPVRKLELDDLAEELAESLVPFHFVRLDKSALLEVLPILGGKSRIGLIATEEEAMNWCSDLREAAPLEREEKVRSVERSVWGPTLSRDDERPGVVGQELVAQRGAAQSNVAEYLDALSTS